jgi:hypothetical protein
MNQLLTAVRGTNVAAPQKEGWAITRKDIEPSQRSVGRGPGDDGQTTAR